MGRIRRHGIVVQAPVGFVVEGKTVNAGAVIVPDVFGGGGPVGKVQGVNHCNVRDLGKRKEAVDVGVGKVARAAGGRAGGAQAQVVESGVPEQGDELCVRSEDHTSELQSRQ